MAIYIDPPWWPAHHTTWSHVISDTSIAELHRFADELGLPAHGFDLDHYDIPANRFDDACSAGAIATTANQLTRTLLASGLRVPSRHRGPLKALRAHWQALLPGQVRLGDELILRWREPHRRYHTTTHLAQTLAAADILLAQQPHSGDDALHVRLALWFHDAVYQGQAGDDEAASAHLAEHSLAPVLGGQAAVRVADLVRVTTTHEPASSDVAAHIVVDADLAILGSTPERYAEYSQAVRSEYAHVPDADFRRGRGAILARLLNRSPLFFTPGAVALWHDAAHANMRGELLALSDNTH